MKVLEVKHEMGVLKSSGQCVRSLSQGKHAFRHLMCGALCLFQGNLIDHKVQLQMSVHFFGYFKIIQIYFSHMIHDCCPTSVNPEVCM